MCRDSGVWGEHLQLAAVVLDEAAVGEEELLPYDGRTQRARAREELLLQDGRLPGRLRNRRGVGSAAPHHRLRGSCLRHRQGSMFRTGCMHEHPWHARIIHHGTGCMHKHPWHAWIEPWHRLHTS